MQICRPQDYSEIDANDIDAIARVLKGLDLRADRVVIDITGLARVPMMGLLSTAYDSGIRFSVIYTEAREYYPTEEYFRKLVGSGQDPGDGFIKLSTFEKEEMIYSGHCNVDEIEGLRGRMLPNYPLMLIAFLTFKRGRVSAILQSYEANVRILIKGVPVRSDLKWRAAAIEVPNFDLLDDSIIEELETLDWQATYRFLSELYERDNNRDKYNFMMAPLGSKMQTVGAWLFAKTRPEVKVVTSTPKEIFHEKYSVGSGQTFLFDDFPQLKN